MLTQQDVSVLFAGTLPAATGDAPGRARMKAQAEDFVVDEQLGYVLKGEGTHDWLKIRKRGANTQWVGEQIARFAGVRGVDIGFAGLKDRHALTTQWFSVNVAGRARPDWSTLDVEGVEVLDVVAHERKLRRGALSGNMFTITLRDVAGKTQDIEHRLAAVRAEGFANYFGEQRFGIERRNLWHAQTLLVERRSAPRKRREIYLSAARSWVFNRVLAARVKAQTWNFPVAGDVMVLDGSNSVFAAPEIDAELVGRCAEFDVHPSGPLPGEGGIHASGDAGRFELEATAPYAAWIEGLIAARVAHARRSLRARADEMHWRWLAGDVLELTFTLRSGCYATVLLGEIIECSDASRNKNHSAYGK